MDTTIINVKRLNAKMKSASQALVDMTAELQRRIQATAGFAADVAHDKTR